MHKSIVSAPAAPSAAGSATLSDVVEGVLDIVARLLNTRLVAASRIEGVTYTVMAVVDRHHTLGPGQLYNVFDTFCLHMLETGQPLRIDDATQAPLPFRGIPQTLELNVRAYLGVPLLMADGRVFGSLWAADTVARSFTDDDLALLQLFARLLAPELSAHMQLRHTERLEHIQALYGSIDVQTGLLARDGFETLLAREAARRDRYGNVYAVAVLQLEPGWHPQVGDTLHQALTDILMRTSRLVDCCARIDDHLFGVLFVETTTAGVREWRRRIDAAVDAWNRLHVARDMELRCQFGIADCMDEQVPAGQHLALLELAMQRAEDKTALEATPASVALHR